MRAFISMFAANLNENDPRRGPHARAGQWGAWPRMVLKLTSPRRTAQKTITKLAASEMTGSIRAFPVSHTSAPPITTAMDNSRSETTWSESAW